jgi:hypothetical protein
MMHSTVLWPEILTVAILGAQLLVLGIAACVAWYQASEARRLRLEQHRPFVVIDVDFVGTSDLFLHVSNLGTSLARHVTIEIDPPLKSSVDIQVDKFKMLKDGISTLAPGKELRTFFDQGFKRNESSLPLVYTATLRYTDDAGKRSFTESMDLDLEQYMRLVFVDHKDIHDVHARLKELGDVLKEWGWSGGGGLLTISRAEADAKNAKRMAEIERLEEQEKE